MYSVLCTLYSVICSIYFVLCTLCHCSLYMYLEFCILYTLLHKMCTIQSTSPSITLKYRVKCSWFVGNWPLLTPMFSLRLLFFFLKFLQFPDIYIYFFFFFFFSLPQNAGIRCHLASPILALKLKGRG